MNFFVFYFLVKSDICLMFIQVFYGPEWIKRDEKSLLLELPAPALRHKKRKRWNKYFNPDLDIEEFYFAECTQSEYLDYFRKIKDVGIVDMMRLALGIFLKWCSRCFMILIFMVFFLLKIEILPWKTWGKDLNLQVLIGGHLKITSRVISKRFFIQDCRFSWILI